MDLKQIRAFVAIADTRSVTRAAQLLHVVQPAVSRQLRLLEDDLGQPLFERSRRGMELTDTGEMLVARARRALRELDQAKAEIVAASGAVTGTVAIGLLPSTSALLASPLVGELTRRYPQLKVQLYAGFAGDLQAWLENGELDVALLYEPRPSVSLEVQPLLDETLYLVGPARAGLSLDRPMALRDIAAIPLVLPGPAHGLRGLLERACVDADLQLSIAIETNSMGIQKDLVASGIGFTVLPSAAVLGDVAGDRLSAAPITSPGLSRRIVMARLVTRRGSTAARVAAVELCACVRQTVLRGDWGGAEWIGAEPGEVRGAAGAVE